MTPLFGPFMRVSSTKEFLQLPESCPKRSLFSDLIIEGPVSTRGSSESSLADTAELLVPAQEIEILALILNQLNGPFTSNMAISRKLTTAAYTFHSGLIDAASHAVKMMCHPSLLFRVSSRPAPKSD
jgi:hypothetical protein